MLGSIQTSRKALREVVHSTLIQAKPASLLSAWCKLCSVDQMIVRPDLDFETKPCSNITSVPTKICSSQLQPNSCSIPLLHWSIHLSRRLVRLNRTCIAELSLVLGIVTVPILGTDIQEECLKQCCDVSKGHACSLIVR